MKDSGKARQLRSYKLMATALFVLMALVYIATFFPNPGPGWIGYVRAFSEAAMVGALADWFAVVALFRHPLGLPVPHTNLIENSKSRIGTNLGQFITGNFLTATTIRPRLQQLKVSGKLGGWLARSANRDLLITEIVRVIQEGLDQLHDEEMEGLISRQAETLLRQLPLNTLAGTTLENILDKGMHEEWITLLAKSMRDFIEANAEGVRDKVKAESHFLIPGFVDNIIASRITRGAITFLRELETDPGHPQRSRITLKLRDLAAAMKTALWERDFLSLKEQILSGQKLREYAGGLWQHLKIQIRADLARPGSAIRGYLDKTLSSMASDLVTDLEKQQRIDRFVQVQAYKLIFRHRNEVSALISHTVGNWKGRELSDKLELEVGKDLQFIRFNGTLVGGLVGLLIYTLTHWWQA